MKKISNLFGKYEKPPQKKRHTERGDLLDYFLLTLNPQRKKDGFPILSHSRLSYLLTKIPTKDLYALKSKMEDARSRGNSPSKRFWFELNPEKYQK